MQVVTHCESEVCLRTIRVLKWFPALFPFREVGYVEGVKKLIPVLHKLCCSSALLLLVNLRALLTDSLKTCIIVLSTFVWFWHNVPEQQDPLSFSKKKCDGCAHASTWEEVQGQMPFPCPLYRVQQYVPSRFLCHCTIHVLFGMNNYYIRGASESCNYTHCMQYHVSTAVKGADLAATKR